MQPRLWMTAALAALFLAACGGSGTSTPSPTPNPRPSPTPGSVTQQGFVFVAYSSAAPMGAGLYGSFVSTTATDLPSGGSFGAIADTCSLDSSTTSPTPLPSTPLDGQSLSAGPALTFKSGGAVYGTATESTSTSGASTTYRYQGQASAAVPTPLTVDVPGAAGGFPAFSGVSVPLAGSFSFSSPAPVTASSSFSWTNPTGSSNFFVSITVQQFSPNVAFSCLARDDGSFSVPASFQGTLSSAKFTSGVVTSAGRIGIRSTTSGSAQLNTLSLDVYGVPFASSAVSQHQSTVGRLLNAMHAK